LPDPYSEEPGIIGNIASAVNAQDIGDPLDWRHIEIHNLSRPVDARGTGGIHYGPQNGALLPIAGLASYPVSLRFEVLADLGCTTVEVRNLEMRVFYLDNAVEH
jgi:hypothetical protein